MNGEIWDPLRKRHVALTPEESVRQWFIEFLVNEVHVPAHMMMSEASIKLGEKAMRVDILVYDRKARPIAVVECKRPEVELNAEVLDQAVRYNMVLNVNYIMITNGKKTCICRKKEGGSTYTFIGHIPSYDEMIGENRPEKI